MLSSRSAAKAFAVSLSLAVGVVFLSGCLGGGGGKEIGDGIVIEDGKLVITRGKDQFVCRQSPEETKALALFQISNTAKFDFDGLIFAMDFQEYQRHRAAYRRFDPFNPRSEGYNQAKRHFFIEPFVVSKGKLTQQVAEIKKMGRLTHEPLTILLKGHPLRVESYRYNGFKMAMPGGERADSPWLFTLIEQK